MRPRLPAARSVPTGRPLAAAAALALACFAGASPVAAQGGVTLLPKGAVPQVLADLPELPKVMALSPRNTLLFADRDEVAPAPGDYPPGTSPSAAWVPTLVNAVISAELTGTGMPEHFQYQLPSDYTPKGSPRPLLVAWHGFGTSAQSVAQQSTLDEQCESWGWIYLAVTGIDDKLFGSPASQQNAAAAIRWMQDHHAVDRDRVYMVGFSMGAGIVANFAARHRDPADLVIAGIGLVSGSFDWTATYTQDAAVQKWMTNPWNFGGTPASVPFAYQRSSALHFDPFTYPPSPGTCVDLLSMASNLHGTPAFITWDMDDTLSWLPAQSEVLGKLLHGWGSEVMLRPVAGTVDGKTGKPATHSWAVLDEADLMNTLAPLSAKRLPAQWNGKLGDDRTVAFAQVQQRSPDAFSHLSGDVDTHAATLRLHHVVNASQVSVDVRGTGLEGQWPLRLQASSGDAHGFELALLGCDTPPSYFRHAADGSLVENLESDPLTGSIRVTVPGGGSVDLLAYSVPWHSALWLSPDPVPPGGKLTLRVAGPADGQLAWVILGMQSQLIKLPGALQIMVHPAPPALMFALPLNGSGQAEVQAALPDAPSLSGVSFVMQAVIQTKGPQLGDATNVFRLDIQ